MQKKIKLMLGSALISTIAIGVSDTATAGSMGKMSMEKCYGINASYKNDCQSPGHSCAGQDSKARDPKGFIAVPSGLCAKIEGGSTKSQ